MISEQSSEQWKETKNKIKGKFSRLSDKQLDALNGNMDKLPSMVEDTYHYDHSKAVEECKPFTENPGRPR